MSPTDEHDDDLEPEVEEGAEIETEHYSDDEELEDGEPTGADEEEEDEDEAGDTM